MVRWGIELPILNDHQATEVIATPFGVLTEFGGMPMDLVDLASARRVWTLRGEKAPFAALHEDVLLGHEDSREGRVIRARDLETREELWHASPGDAGTIVEGDLMFDSGRMDRPSVRVFDFADPRKPPTLLAKLDLEKSQSSTRLRRLGDLLLVLLGRRILGLDARTLRERWTTAEPAIGLAPVGDDTVLASLVGQEGCFALDRSGRVLWRRKYQNCLAVPFAGAVLVYETWPRPPRELTFTLLDRRTGEPLWERKLGPMSHLSAVEVAGGVAYVVATGEGGATLMGLDASGAVTSCRIDITTRSCLLAPFLRSLYGLSGRRLFRLDPAS